MTDTYSIYEDWSSEAMPVETQHSYEKASQKLLLCTEYEEKLVCWNNNLIYFIACFPY